VASQASRCGQHSFSNLLHSPPLSEDSEGGFVFQINHRGHEGS